MQVVVSGHAVELDAEDLPLFNAYPWRLQCGYLIRRPRIGGKRVLVHFHREVLKPADGLLVDHINGNRLDNRRANLRTCTHAENMRNRKRAKSNKSGVKGVYMDKATGKWRAEIGANGKSYRLGMHHSIEAAGKAYAAAAARLHGEFARAA